MTNAILLAAEAMGAMADANRATEETTASALINVVPVSLELTMAYLKNLSTAHWNYFVDLTGIDLNPNKAATAAADYGTYQALSSEMTSANQKQNTFIEALKSMLTKLEESAPYKMMDAFDRFMAAVYNIESNLSKGA